MLAANQSPTSLVLSDFSLDNFLWNKKEEITSIICFLLNELFKITCIFTIHKIVQYIT
jgi:hypothetical protein